MIQDYIKQLVTGNEFVSISDISSASGGIGKVGFLHKGFKACMELRGSKDMPLLKPIVMVGDTNILANGLESDLCCNWIPQFVAESEPITATASFFAPLERRGFVCLLTLRNSSKSSIKVRAGWEGCWKSSCVTANISRNLNGTKHGSVSSWKEGVPVIEFRGQTPSFAMALLSQEVTPAEIWDGDGQDRVKNWAKESVSVPSGQMINYRVSDNYVLRAEQEMTIALYVGIGLEEVSAVASAHELSLQGWNRTFEHTKEWLRKHTIECEDEYFSWLINYNSFFSYFYSQGITLDTEEVVMTSSRNSANQTCGAYMDRDAMRWSIPAILQVSWAQARKAMIYAFTTQLRNVGTHTRFLDGIVMEPGLQLDQLCAPIRALTLYTQHTGDMSIVFDRRVQVGVNRIQQILAAQRHPEVALFETLLLPSGEPSKLPYVCYSNMLVWRILRDIGWIYNHIRDMDRAEEAVRLANLVRAAIMEHFVVDGPNGKMYAKVIDLEGNFIIGDDPAGSLVLMTYFDFCPANDPIYRNTVSWIHSDQNPQSGSGHPFVAQPSVDESGASVIGVINDLLTERKQAAIDFLRRAKLDDGIACETVDHNTGEAISGRASAGCAGYLAFSLRRALNAVCPQTAVVKQKRRPSETLYEPPPETNLDTKKARL